MHFSKPLAISFLTLSTAAPMTEQSGHIDSAEVTRLVVIPDTHGDSLATAHALFLAFKEIEPNHPEVQTSSRFYEILIAAVTRAEYPAAPLSTATEVGLIQLGDLVDRGPFGEACLGMFLVVPRLLGWRSWILYGNHEFLSMAGPAQKNPYCNKRERELYGSFENRDTVYGFTALSPLTLPFTLVPLCLAKDDQRPSSSEPYARQCDMYTKLNENSLGLVRWGPPLVPTTQWSASMLGSATLFVHGGVDLDWLESLLQARAEESDEDLIDAVNAEVRKRMRNLHEPQNSQIMGEPSILWDRSLTNTPADLVCRTLLPAILRRFQVSRLVVGHTPQLNGRVNLRCGGRLVLADAMMSRWMWATNVDEKTRMNPVVLHMQTEPTVPNELESMKVVYGGGRVDADLYSHRFQAEKQRLSNQEPALRVTRSSKRPRSELTTDVAFGRVFLRFSDGTVLRETSSGIVNYGSRSFALGADIEELARVLNTLLTVVESGVVLVPGECLDTLMMEFSHVFAAASADLVYLESLIDQVESIVATAHASGFTMGFDIKVSVLAYFCVAPGASENVKLVNWTGVAKRSEHDEEKQGVKAEIDQLKSELRKKRQSAIARAAGPVSP